MPLNSNLPLFANRIDRFCADVSFNLQRLFKKGGKHTVCALPFLYGICEEVSRTAIEVSRHKKKKRRKSNAQHLLIINCQNTGENIVTFLIRKIENAPLKCSD